MKFFHNIFKTMVLFATIVTISFGSTNQPTYEYKYNSGEWKLYESSQNSAVKNPTTQKDFSLTIDHLYNYLKQKNINEVIAEIVKMIKKQNNLPINSTLGYEDEPKLRKFTNTLVDHIVDKGHYGYIPWAPKVHNEDKGMVKIDRIETNEPRSYFNPSTEIKRLSDIYTEDLKSKLADLFYPGVVSRAEQTDPIYTSYSNLINEMKKEASYLIKDILNNQYKCIEMDCNYKTQTIRIIAKPDDSQMRNGVQQDIDSKNYRTTNKNICIYLSIENGQVKIPSVFPASNLNSLGQKTFDIPNITNPSISYN